MGAAGRDFHDFLVHFRDRPELQVCCFTAAQIPFIEQRSFPRELAGPHYDADIPIHPEGELPALIARHAAEWVFLCYSDLSHAQVMHRASIAQAAGASFALLGPRHTEIELRRPVIAVTAVRTGAGKSPISQHLCRHLAGRGHRVAVVRHPMPYGDLLEQRVQRFETLADLEAQDCTIEEREEYAPYLEQGQRVYAGVDYRAIAQRAEAESDVVIWDGGNNDRAFYRPDLQVVALDALRPDDGLGYYPGETNLRCADVLVITKVDAAGPEAAGRVRAQAAEVNPAAELLEADLALVTDAAAIAGKRVLVVEDGPTLTHGGMSHGAGFVAAQRAGAAELIDPRPHAVGSIAETFERFEHLGPVLPALGYADHQLRELRETIEASGAELVVDASPAGVSQVLDLKLPCVRVRYRFEQRSGTPLEDIVDAVLAR
jgi:predicted GTPase